MPKSSILGTFSGKSCDSNVFNNNDMHLGRKLFENVIASQEYKDGIKRGHYIGFLGHPEDPGCQDFRNACIVMTSMNIEDNGDVYADFNLVNTPVGQIVKAFIDAGVQFGISIRGAGDVEGDGEVDPETFVFRGYDLVAFPAYNDCVPKFQEIAASKDVENQKKYKKICAAVKSNLKSITSAEALETIKSQLVEGSEPYNEVESRIAELSAELTPVDVPSPEMSLEEQKIDALVTMYSDASEYIEQLESENARLSESVQQVTTQLTASTSKVKRMTRIHASQMQSLEEVAKDAQAQVEVQHQKYLRASRTIDELNQKIAKSQKLNLNYSQKIQASEALLSQKETELERLHSQLRETVTASRELKVNASNYDAELDRLRKKVEAAEEMVYAYQQAYANLFANAIGKEVSELPVTASTTPEDLRKSILGATNTGNIAAKPDIADDEYFCSDDTDDGLVSL